MLMVNGENNAARDTMNTINHFLCVEKIVYGCSTVEVVRLNAAEESF
jgi:hypothetical protein